MLGAADHLYAADSHWWHHYIADIKCSFQGKLWSCDPRGNTNWNTTDPVKYGIEILHCRIEAEAKGLWRTPGTVNSGGNSGYQAINLAYHLGAQRIILLGFDMHNHSGLSHWFGDHPPVFPGGSDAARFISAFRSIKPADYGIEIINCSRVTALDAFPRHNLEDVFA